MDYAKHKYSQAFGEALSCFRPLSEDNSPHLMYHDLISQEMALFSNFVIYVTKSIFLFLNF